MRKLLVLFAALGMAGALYAADSFTGTWRLDTAKSKIESFRGPKEETVTERKERGITDMTATGINGSGRPIAIHLTFPTNGGPIKFLEGAPRNGTTYSVERVNANTRRQTVMRGGKEVETEEITVGADGKTQRVVAKGMLPNGKPFTDVAVFEKQ